MPRGETTRGLDPGTRAEVRVAQAWFWDGYFVRRGVDLQHRFGDQVSTITDLDVLGVGLDNALVAHRHIGEVKTGTSKNTPRPLDRALWMRGLRELVGAERAEVTTAFPTSGSARDACSRLGVTVQQLEDLAQREMRLHIAEFNDLGSQGEAAALVRADVQAFVKSDPVLERGYWFLVSEVWFLEPFDALKRTLGLIRELTRLWPVEALTRASGAARWFFAESIALATLNLAVIAGQANTMDARTFRDMARSRLSSGDVPIHSIRALSDRIDAYVGKLLTSAKAPADVIASAMGAFQPVPPDYTEPLIELIRRLAEEPAPTARLPRQMDMIVYERLVRRRELSPQVRSRLGMSYTTERQARLIAAFLRGQFDVPPDVDAVLTTTLDLDRSAHPEQQPTLFEPGNGASTDVEVHQPSNGAN